MLKYSQDSASECARIYNQHRIIGILEKMDAKLYDFFYFLLSNYKWLQNHINPAFKTCIISLCWHNYLHTVLSYNAWWCWIIHTKESDTQSLGQETGMSMSKAWFCSSSCVNLDADHCPVGRSNHDLIIASWQIFFLISNPLECHRGQDNMWLKVQMDFGGKKQNT